MENKQTNPLTTATEILQRRQRSLARRWRRHEYELLDIFTITFSYIDVSQQFMNLALVNKWFYHQVHKCLANIEEVVCVNDKDFVPINRLSLYLDKLYRVKISKNYLRFDVEELDDRDQREEYPQEEMNEPVTNFQSAFANLMKYGRSLVVPPVPKQLLPRSRKETTLVKNLIIFINLSDHVWSSFNSYKIETVFFIGTYWKYYSSVPVLNSGTAKFDNIIFFRCYEMVQRFYQDFDETLYENATYINSKYIDYPSINTFTIEIDDIVEMMKTYSLFSMPPSIIQYKPIEIKEYVNFEKSGSAISGNLLWQALKKHEQLYPYFQLIFNVLGLYYLKSMLADISSTLERNFRTFLEKWNSKVQVKKLRLNFLISTAIYCDSIIEEFIVEATKIDHLLEKKKSMAMEKSKLESLSKWISDTYKNRPNKKVLKILLQ